MAEGFFTTVWVYSLPKATLLAVCIKRRFVFFRTLPHVQKWTKVKRK